MTLVRDPQWCAVLALVLGGCSSALSDGDEGDGPEERCEAARQSMLTMLDEHADCTSDTDCTMVFSGCLRVPGHAYGAYAANDSLDVEQFDQQEAVLHDCLPPEDCGALDLGPEGAHCAAGQCELCDDCGAD